MVDGAGIDALAGLLDWPLAVWRPVAIGSAGHECFDAAYVCARYAVEFCEFDDPYAGELQCCVLGSEIGDFICKPGGAERLYGGRFPMF